MSSLLKFFVILTLCSSCASLRGTRQRVKVASSPAGAEIHHEGEKLGVTPAFVELRRRKENTLTLKKTGMADIPLLLPTEYRWGNSFAANFVWFVSPLLVPAGMGIDLWTGAAWDYSHIPVVRWNRSAPIEPTPVKKVALAPPQASNQFVSDELAEHLEKAAAEKFKGAELIPFNNSVDTFARYAYFHQQKTDPEYRDDLYYALGVSHIVETDTEEKDGHVIMKSRVIDIFTDQESSRFETEVPVAQVRTMNEGYWWARFKSLVSIVPNTFAINLSGSAVGISEKSDDPAQQYRSRAQRGDNALLNVLSSISLRNVRNSEVTRRWKATFRFVPSVVIGYNRFVFDRQTGHEIDGVGFSWYTMSVGIGPELGLEAPVGYLYWDIIPAYGGSYVTWSKNGDQSDFRGGITVESEWGYLVFVSQNVNLRFFLNYVGTDRQQWNSILTKATGRDIEVQASAFATVGIGIGYYFPEIKSRARRLVR